MTPGNFDWSLVEVVDLLLADRGLHDDRRQRVEAALVHLARERARRHVEHLREPLHEVVAPLLRHVADPELDRRSGDVRDDDAAAAVEQRAARSLDADEAELVRLRGGEVLVAGEHLQRPQPQEEDAEHGERDDAEDRDAQRELRREPVRLAHPRIRGQEPVGRRSPLLVRAARHTSTSTSGASLQALPFADDPAHERVHGKGEHDVQHEGGRERGHERMTGDDVLVEEVVEDEAECRREHGDRPDGDDRGEAPVASGRLRRSDRPRTPRA